MNNANDNFPVYQQLLSTTRAKPTSLPGRTLIVEAESDRSRIVFSPPFRRLQQKAQVFSLEANAAVRSRLTHSMEVAQIGRFLADLIVDRLIEERLMNSRQARAFVTFIEAACLMHDLGNPPFGHFGEAAISDWFRKNGERLLRTATSITKKEASNNLEESSIAPIEAALADFLEFDGNCQGLRIATLLQWNDHEHGLNLTFTALAAYLKYIRAPLYDPREAKKKRFQKKAGFFNTERETVEALWKHFGYDTSAPKRFPLAYVMEAADDIAYCISDLEDSIEKNLLNTSSVFKNLKEAWDSHYKKIQQPDKYAEKIQTILSEAESSAKNNNTTFTRFRTTLSTLLTEIACETYCAQHEQILQGTLDGLIPEGASGGLILSTLKDFCREHVYQHSSVQRKELAGLNAISGLLDHYAILLECNESRFLAALDGKTKDDEERSILIERKLLSLFPERYKTAYRHKAGQIKEQTHSKQEIKSIQEWNLRAHLITDFISGMTDDFALWSFQMLSGIRSE